MLMAKLRGLLHLTASARRQSVSMRRKLMLYWLSMILCVFAALALLLSVSGLFNIHERRLQNSLQVQQKSAAASMQQQLDTLSAQAISFSADLSTEIETVLAAGGVSFSELNDDQALLLELQKQLYAPLNTTLQVCSCSGAYFILDATINTALPNAAASRSGMYLRYPGLNTLYRANQTLTYYRGIPDVARQKNIQLHNRWNLEFDVTGIPGFSACLRSGTQRLADCCLWSGRMDLPDTWEDVMLLSVPILGTDGSAWGACGVELNELYFKLLFPTVQCPYGSIVTALCPLEGGLLRMDEAMLGSTEGTQLAAEGSMRVQHGRFFNQYQLGPDVYLGLHETPSLRSTDGRAFAVVTLIPRAGYLHAVRTGRAVWLAMLAGLLALMVLLARTLSQRFAGPIASSLSAIRSEQPDAGRQSGISEIDELLAFARSKAQQKLTEGTLPPNIAELFSAFAGRVQTLTPSEHAILQLYINGHEPADIPAVAFISISTVKKHNSNIYRKLGVTTREELMLYIDLFRRCGRLEELTSV